jgi:phage terminase small subunit
MKKEPSDDLSEESKAFFKSISEDYELESSHLQLLRSACECLDRSRQARAILAKDGIVFTDRHGHIRPHPATQIERDNKALFARLLREIGLDVVESSSESRPPKIQGNANLKVRNA